MNSDGRKQMTTQHTPGPWRVGDAAHTIFGPKQSDGSLAVTIASVAGNARMEDYRANARLIAAAPDLLAALKDITAKLASYEKFPDGSGNTATFDKARAAIAKAEGKQ
jgi:hypothetical protein